MTTELTKSEQDIQQTIEKFTAAWNNRNAKAFAQLFAEDADLTNVLSENFNRSFSNKAAFMDMFMHLFERGNLIQKEVRIRLISQNLASVNVAWHACPLTHTQREVSSGHLTLLQLILKREQGVWLIYIMYSLDLPGVSAN